MNIFAKLKNRGGFSLTELLITVLILALVSTVVAAGMPSAVKAYKSIVEKANAQLLLTTATSALRNELDMASELAVTSEPRISFISSKNYRLEIFSSSAEGIMVKGYTESGSEVHTENDDPPAALVSNAASSKNLRVEFSGAVYDEVKSILTIQGLKVTNSEDKVLASLSEYTIEIFR